MANELDVFDRLSVTKRIPKADDLTAYYQFYMKLCQDYREDIDHIYALLKELREERTDFFENKIKLIRHSLAEEKVSPEAIDNWTEKLKNDMERSFDVSESFVRDFLVKKHDEFKKELEKRMNQV